VYGVSNKFCPSESQTDHTTQSVTIGYIYTCSTAMQPKMTEMNQLKPIQQQQQ